MKVKGESSMSEKRGNPEATERSAARGPVGMVKPILVESEYPTCQTYRPETVVVIRDQSDSPLNVVGGENGGRSGFPSQAVLDWVGQVSGLKGTERAPNPTYRQQRTECEIA